MGNLLLIGAALLLGGAVGGVAIGSRQTAGLEATASLQAEHLAAIHRSQQDLAATLSRPVTLDAELRAELAQTPPACVLVLGGDPLSAQCLLQACWQYGQSAAQRPDCDAVETLAVETLTPETPIEL